MLFLIPHLFPSPRMLEAAAQDLHLPALQTLLVRGRRAACLAEGVEAALCEALGVQRQQDWPIAPISVQQDGGAAEGAYWLRADPVHLRLMRDRVVLADSGDPALTQQEANALAASIAEHFGDAFRPLPLRPMRWYLRLDQPPRLSTTPPSVATGLDIDPLLPRGDDAMRYRALLNEVQMLLHGHPVNEAREARGALPVNSLWLWGGGTLPARPPERTTLYCRDEGSRAIGAYCGTTLRELPDRCDRRMLDSASVIVLDALTPAGQCGDPYGWREALRTLESDWFAPLRDVLRTSGAAAVRLADPISGRALLLDRAAVWKIWRRPRNLTALLR